MVSCRLCGRLEVCFIGGLVVVGCIEVSFRWLVCCSGSVLIVRCIGILGCGVLYYCAGVVWCSLV